MKIALTIAGSDSGGGAGIQADLKTFHQFGVFGTSVIVAVTAQNTRGVSGIHTVPPDIVLAQMQALAGDLHPAATKTGMLATGELVESVASGLRAFKFPNYVLDPVMVSSSGDELLDGDARKLLRRELVARAAVITPNLHEAGILVEDEITTVPAMERAGRALVRMGAQAALIKGGHLEGDEVVDVLVTRSETRGFARRKLMTSSTHGTGCTLSAALAAGLARGRPLVRAVADALDFVHRAIEAAPEIGRGHGPLNHWVETRPD